MGVGSCGSTAAVEGRMGAGRGREEGASSHCDDLIVFLRWRPKNDCPYALMKSFIEFVKHTRIQLAKREQYF